ncbi:unnamed protein product, partial [Meganyctiphanes norvegica]
KILRMSLGQLTANYTDSEGEEDRLSDEGSPQGSTPEHSRVSELREGDGAGKGTPASIDTTGSGTNTPVKKAVSRLVSYSYGVLDDDDLPESDNEEENKDTVEPDEELNSVPMDTGTDEEEEKSSPTSHRTHDLGIELPPPPPGKASQQLQDNVTRYVNNVRRGNKDYDVIIQSKKEFRNPSIYEKLIDLLDLDEMGSNYPLDRFDPHMWVSSKDHYYDEIARVQKEEMDRREKERKDKTKVDVITGTKKSSDEDPAKKRKSRFDQVGPPATIPTHGVMKHPVAPPMLTSVPSGTKTTIEAFGSLKKTK